MNSRTRKLVAVSMLIAIGMSGTLSASAGVLDWFTSGDAVADSASTGSFDTLYVSVMETGRVSDDVPLMLAQAVLPVYSPVGGVQKTVRRIQYVQVSGYNSEVAQTDDSPFITANGTYVRDGIVAANHLPFNTALKFKNCGDIEDDKIFIVTDRMNKRYQNNVDIWFASKADALKLGRRMCQIEIIQ
jgi:3D (Asp-Asp-Asp) domain-containing protein